MPKGFWRIEWLDAKDNRRIDFPAYSEANNQHWQTYVKAVGGRVVSMTFVSRKPEGQPNVVQER